MVVIPKNLLYEYYMLTVEHMNTKKRELRKIKPIR